MRQVISQQGEAAEAAANLKQGQDVVFNALQQRFNDSAAVNIDRRWRICSTCRTPTPPTRAC